MKMVYLLCAVLLFIAQIQARTIHGASPPTQLPDQSNIVAHFDAATIGGTNGVKFSSWTDTVSGIIAAQATSANQATFATNRLNSKPSAQGLGAAFMTITSPGVLKTAFDSGVFSVIIVFRTLGSTTAGTLFGASTDNTSLQYVADGTGVGRGVGLYAPYAGQTTFSTVGSTLTNTYGSFAASPNYENLFVNGGSAGPDTPTLTTGGNTIAIFGNANGTFPVNAEIFDIIVWKSQLTPTQYLQAEMWACDKFAQPYPWASVSALTIFDGDSQTAGAGSTNIANSYPYLVAKSLGLSYGQWSNLGVGGAGILANNTLAPTQIDNVAALINKNVHLVAYSWFHQQSTAFTDANTYLAARKAASARTFIAWGTSTDGNFDTPTEASRTSYDNAFDAAHTLNIDVYIPIHTLTTIGTNGAFIANPTLWSDDVHLSNAGQAAEAAFVAPLAGTLP